MIRAHCVSDSLFDSSGLTPQLGYQLQLTIQQCCCVKHAHVVRDSIYHAADDQGWAESPHIWWRHWRFEMCCFTRKLQVFHLWRLNMNSIPFLCPGAQSWRQAFRCYLHLKGWTSSWYLQRALMLWWIRLIVPVPTQIRTSNTDQSDNLKFTYGLWPIWGWRLPVGLNTMVVSLSVRWFPKMFPLFPVWESCGCRAELNTHKHVWHARHVV